MLKFKKVSLLGWSDGGITALIAAARYPSYINKMVIWGANAYVTDQDEEIYRGRSLHVESSLPSPDLSQALFWCELTSHVSSVSSAVMWEGGEFSGE